MILLIYLHANSKKGLIYVQLHSQTSILILILELIHHPQIQE
jgi:hypothetical protein